MAMDADDGFAGAEFGDGIVEALNKGAVLLGDGPADGVGNVHGGGAGGDDRAAALNEEIRLGAGGVLGGKFDVIDKGFGAADAFDGEAEDFVLGLVELEFAVDFGGGEEDVDAAAFAGGFDRLAGGVDVARDATGEAAMMGPLISLAMVLTDVKSPSLMTGKPASMTSTLRRASWRATSSFSRKLMEAPGHCSPSRKVVSKIMILFFIKKQNPIAGLAMRFGNSFGRTKINLNRHAAAAAARSATVEGSDCS